MRELNTVGREQMAAELTAHTAQKDDYTEHEAADAANLCRRKEKKHTRRKSTRAQGQLGKARCNMQQNLETMAGLRIYGCRRSAQCRLSNRKYLMRYKEA